MSGWIGVDLDGTLAEYHTGDGIDSIGTPIIPMVLRVRQWLDEGMEVRIFTARVAACGRTNADGIADDEAFAAAQREMIETWCQRHIGKALPITATKDFGMIQLWDDRVMGVIPNTGKSASDHYYALGLEHGRADVAGQAEAHFRRGYNSALQGATK
jgi:hypothetical protein